MAVILTGPTPSAGPPVLVTSSFALSRAATAAAKFATACATEIVLLLTALVAAT